MKAIKKFNKNTENKMVQYWKEQQSMTEGHECRKKYIKNGSILNEDNKNGE